MATTNMNNSNVVLKLYGIDKNWVRSSKGDWVDEKTLEKLDTQFNTESTDEINVTNKKWWQFWK